jgi:hypothetical protein
MYGAPSFEPINPVDHRRTKREGAILARYAKSISGGGSPNQQSGR